MPLSGGATDKFGNRFELMWTLRCITDVMHETAASIYLEPPGMAGDGVEFILARGLSREYHQVKRQYSKLGRWSLAAMESERVLSRFWDKLCADMNSQCHFVSSFAADELQELTENARSAADLSVFQQEFLAKSKDRANWFSELRKHWGNSAHQEVYSALKRVFVRTTDEYSLDEEVKFRLATIVDALPSHVAGLLEGFIAKNIHHHLRTIDLWQFLEGEGIYRREWNNDPHILAAVAAQNERYLEPLRRDAVAGFIIPRTEVAQIRSALEAKDAKQGIMASGEAGVGKSGVGLQIADCMRQQGWPILAFRIDQFATMQSPRDVGRQMELPESPVTVLANLAQNQPCLMVIDQLDAISKASGRNTHFFDCVAEMINQAKQHPAMRVVLLCRQFDIANDERLRRLTGTHGFANEISVGRLDHEMVRETVTRLGLNAQNLLQKQLDLLSIPLHLKLLSEIASSEEVLSLNFKTANDLYRAFWSYKRSTLTERLGRSVMWNQVVYTLCDHMSNTRGLIAAREIVDEYEADAEAMVSERVLITDGPYYRFFHETFFDYVFARRFVSTGTPLLSLLLAEEQHLFRRAQVRQILAYSREAAFEVYLSDVAEILASSHVRFHIKQVVFALLRQLSSPTPQEWDILAPILDDPAHPLHGEAWQLVSQGTWFRLAMSLGIIETWLTGDDARIDQTIRLIGVVAREVPEDIASLLDGRDVTQDVWRKRLIYVFSWIELGKSRRLFDLFLRLLREGTLDGIRAPMASNGDFWLLIHSLAEDKPEWYCEALGAYLSHHVDLNLARSITNPFAPRFTFQDVEESVALPSETYSQSFGTIAETQFDHNIVSVAQKAPQLFAAHVFDFVVQVAERNIRQDGNPPYQDTVWPWRSYGDVHGIADTLLKALEIALGVIAASDPEKLVPFAERLRTSETQTAQYLLVRAYTQNGQRFAEDAVTYFCTNPERFHAGWSDSGYWATRLLLEATTPYCSAESLRQLETAILGYYTDYERSAKSYQKGHGTMFGYHQLILLNGIAVPRRSPAAALRLEQWRRKFQRQDGHPAQSILGGFVGSPLPESVCHQMTDGQWLLAIAEYGSDKTRWDRDIMVGGAHQLSQQLQARTKEEPARFANLLLRLPATTNLAYFDAILRSLGETNEDIEIAMKVCRYCHSLPERPCGRSICAPITKLGKQELPEEIMAMVAWYATEAPDPPDESVQDRVGQRKSELEFQGINSVRGSAAMAIADLLFDDNSRTAYFIPTLEKLVLDPFLAVRACSVTVLTAALNADRDMAVRLFLRLVEGVDDALLATQYTSQFLYYALYTHFEQLTPVLERMLASNQAPVAEAGALRTCLIALRLKEALPLAQICLIGTQPQRKGAASVFAHNIAAASDRVFCEAALTALFQDEDAEVREIASRCFQQFENDALKDFTGLVEAFVKSPGLAERSFFLVHALENTTARLPDITCTVCERFLAAVGSQAGDIRTSMAGEATTVSKLVVRTYEQSNDKTIQSRCLNLVDQMAQQAVHGLHEALSLLDR